ncbi:unnamed protein product [Adineta ricciae]|uniref:Uncharacterized protein n=1 Tax=Adineta ricciae TaxID=249248 RepID=A0A814CXF8_ADIRI|nr:unnamed protein product [Adineta ricciae]CAF1071337.1 unnamed protein product [Adineta ricciae]
MASSHFVDTKRFVHRSTNKKLVAYVSPLNQSRSHVTAKAPQTDSWSPSPPPSPLTDELQLPSRERTRVLVREERRVPISVESRLPVRREQRIPISFESRLPVREEQHIPIRMEPQISTREEYPPSSPERLVNVDTPRADVPATRRVIVVRSKNPSQHSQRSNRSMDGRREDTVTIPISTSTGNKSIYFIRRPIVPTEEEEATTTTTQ